MVPLTDHGYEILNTKPKKAIDYHSVEMMNKIICSYRANPQYSYCLYSLSILLLAWNYIRNHPHYSTNEFGIN